MERLPLDRVVVAGEVGTRLDQVLSGWLSEPRTRTQERQAAGEVLVDGRAVVKSHRVQAGERITVATPPVPATSPAPPPVPVRYADEHLVVVAKPAGLVVHAGAGTRGPTLVDALRAMGMPLAASEDPARPGIVHRLDRGTSGLLVVASSQAAHAGLAAIFSTHAVERLYWALVDGVPHPAKATIDAPIARSRRNRARFAVDSEGRPAVSHYDVIVDHGRAAELTVRLETGRTHQVRVHLGAVGHPVAGDETYGASPLGAELGLDRPALHARRLAFVHPVTGARIAVDEPLPDDLNEARKRLMATATPVSDTCDQAAGCKCPP